MIQRTQGIQLKTNFHEITFLAGRPIYEYELEIMNSTPELIQEAFRQYRPKILELLTKYMSIDNKIYSPKIIDGIEKARSKPLGTLQNQEEAEQIVSIKLINRLSENHISKNQIIARLIKQVMRNQQEMVSIGKSGSKLFWYQKSISQEQSKLEIWPGVECIYQPSAFQNFKPKLVIDCAFKILRNKTVLEELNSGQNKIGINFDKIIGQIVMTTYNKKFYEISGVELTMTPKSTFQNQNGEAITFESYFTAKYNVKQIEKQPLLKAIVKGKKDESQKEIYLIPSLCQMTGLTAEMRSDFHQMKRISEITKPSAEARMRTAQEFIEQLQTLNKYNKKEALKEWGLEIQKDCIQIQAQKLDPGHMLMGKDLKLNLGDNRTNLDRQTQTQMFQTPPQKLILGILYNNTNYAKQQLNSFLQHFGQACVEFQFTSFYQPKVREMREETELELDRQLRDLKIEADQNQSRVNFLIFLLSGQKKKAKLYKACKRISMANFGCASQVILEKTLQSNTRSIVNKILIQLNAKIGGTPWALDGIPDIFTNQPTMICGVDIFSKAGRKSQLAFCSTINRYFSRYYSQVITSGEFCSHLQQCLKAALLAFRQELSVFPKNVIIYRDGVGDGQQVAVLGTELPQYKQALQELELKDVSLTLVICNKRVSAKFYTGGQGRPENPPPGTVIDNKIITNEDAIKFYLISQQSRQGTVTPTLYKVLYSDLQGIEQNIKILTFKLCWLFYNFTGSIKIPAPVRYAHCLCNFIGDNYDDKDQIKFLPQSDLIHQKVLFYI